MYVGLVACELYAGLAACRFMAALANMLDWRLAALWPLLPIGIVRVWWIGGLSLCAGLAAPEISSWKFSHGILPGNSLREFVAGILGMNSPRKFSLGILTVFLVILPALPPPPPASGKSRHKGMGEFPGGTFR